METLRIFAGMVNVIWYFVGPIVGGLVVLRLMLPKKKRPRDELR